MDHPPVDLSFVIPAWNEQAELPATIAAIGDAAAALDPPRSWECLVVDDDSSDATADVARAAGARVVPVALRQIAAVRNAGAAAAAGSVFVFVDADTRVTAEAVRAALVALETGAVCGGARVRFDRPVPWWAHGILAAVMAVSRAGRLATGCFVFCTREAFDASGGFDERYYATEELVFSRALARVGRVVIVPAHVETSARKVALFGLARILLLMLRVALRGPGAVRRREGLEVWYGDGASAAPRE